MIQFPLREKEQRRERGSERGKRERERERKGEDGRREGKSATTMPKHNGKCSGA